ncbi:MAG: DUF4230 domain-containing protein [Bacteroidota bacterium]
MINRILQLLAIVAAFAVGGVLSYEYFAPKAKIVEDSTVLLEKIQAVTKLITVEGQFSEIYNYSEYQGYFTYFWDKKILVRVRATVSAGYDLNNLHITADPVTKTIHISSLGAPQILAIDHTLDYYDISQGLFTSFTPEDYNKINQRAKDMIRDQAMKSNLLPSAQEQAVKMIDLIRFMVESAGWKLDMPPGAKGNTPPQ